MSKQGLFEDFEGVSSEQWRAQIASELKNQTFDSLRWKSPEGIEVAPFYHADESLPLHIPNRSGEWKIVEHVEFTEVSSTSQLILKAIKGGADGIYLGGAYTLEEALELLNIHADQNIDWHIQVPCAESSLSKVGQLSNTLQSRLFIGLDPIGHLAKTGLWIDSQSADLELFKSRLKTSTACRNQVLVNLELYQNSGANMVEQLAFGLSHANEYLNLADGISPLTSVVFEVAVGSDYFFEIAKIRALRWLWESLTEGLELGRPPCHILAKTTERNKTIYDYNTNLLRSTTECMSAIIGGADSIVNLPYDFQYHYPNDFGQRIARNQLLILKKESHFQAVNNPADGSYYLDHLTHKLAEEALNLFKQIENRGGFLHGLESGFIPSMVLSSATKEQLSFDQGDKVLVGANAFVNEQEQMISNIERLRSDANQDSNPKSIKPIRLAAAKEFSRMAKEKQ